MGHYVVLRNGPHFCPPKCPDGALGVIAACPSWFKSSVGEIQTWVVLRARRWPDLLRIEQLFCYVFSLCLFPFIVIISSSFFSFISPFIVWVRVSYFFIINFPFSLGANSSSVLQDTSNKNNLVRGWLLVFFLLYFYDCMHMLLLALLLNSSWLIIFYSLLIFLNYIIGHINYHLSCILIQTAAQLPIKRNVWPWCSYCSHSARRGPHAPRRPSVAPPTPLPRPAHTLSSPPPIVSFVPATLRPAHSHATRTISPRPHAPPGRHVYWYRLWVCLYPWRLAGGKAEEIYKIPALPQQQEYSTAELAKIIFQTTVLLTDPFSSSSSSPSVSYSPSSF